MRPYKYRNSDQKANAHNTHKRYEQVAEIVLIAADDYICVIRVRVKLSDIYAARVADEHGWYLNAKFAARAHCDHSIGLRVVYDHCFEAGLLSVVYFDVK